MRRRQGWCNQGAVGKPYQLQNALKQNVLQKNKQKIKRSFWKCNMKDHKKGTRQSKQCGFSIYIFDNLKSKSMVRLVRAEKMVLSGLVFARKIARMILIQNI